MIPAMVIVCIKVFGRSLSRPTTTSDGFFIRDYPPDPRHLRSNKNFI